MKYLPILLLSLVTFSGCDSLLLHNTQEYEEAAIAQAALEQEEVEKSKQLTTAVVDVLKDEEADKVTPHSKLALNFAVQDQLLEGLPIDPISVDSYIELAVSTNQSDIDRLETKLAVLEKEVTEFRENKQYNEIVLDERSKQLIELGKKYEEENKKKVWQKVWHWGIGTFGVGGLIAIAVFFPAIIPIIGQLVGSVIRVIPTLASALGVAATKTVDSIIKGVQSAKKEVKSGNKETYSRDEVLEILSRNLNDHQTNGDRALVSQRKTKIKV